MGRPKGSLQGNYARGEERLTDAQRAKIVWLYDWGCEVCHIAERFGLGNKSILQVLRAAGRHQTWVQHASRK